MTSFGVFYNVKPKMTFFFQNIQSSCKYPLHLSRFYNFLSIEPLCMTLNLFVYIDCRSTGVGNIRRIVGILKLCLSLLLLMVHSDRVQQQTRTGYAPHISLGSCRVHADFWRCVCVGAVILRQWIRITIKKLSSFVSTRSRSHPEVWGEAVSER